MNKIKFLTIAVISTLVVLSGLRIRMDAQDSRTDMLKSNVTTADPPSIQMYYYIEKYSQEFDIPRNYAYGIAYCETRYRGPFDWDYNPYQTSPVGALGPMQVMPTTAQFVNGSRPSNKKLKTDIQYNVRTSMKLLRYLKDKYGDWKLVFGCYNTGRPMVNQYAINVYQFQPNW
jgi:soluble lytic murein transglycosylase-like protein